MSSTQNDAALAEQLPYWEFFEAPFGHLALLDGSLVAGMSLGLKDIECLDDNEINQFTSQLRTVLNSISEDTSVQFHLSVNSDFSDTVEKHIKNKKDNCHALIRNIANNRESRLLEDLKSGDLYRPKLTVFVRTKMVKAKKSGLFAKPEVFSNTALESYAETLELLNQNLGGIGHSIGLNEHLDKYGGWYF